MLAAQIRPGAGVLLAPPATAHFSRCAANASSKRAAKSSRVSVVASGAPIRGASADALSETLSLRAKSGCTRPRARLTVAVTCTGKTMRSSPVAPSGGTWGVKGIVQTVGCGGTSTRRPGVTRPVRPRLSSTRSAAVTSGCFGRSRHSTVWTVS